MRSPHPHRGLLTLGIVHLVVTGCGVLIFFAGLYVAAFCGDGVEDAPRCDHVRTLWWSPAVALAVSSAVAVLVSTRARRTHSQRAQLLLGAASVLCAVVMIAIVLWYFGRVDSAAPPA